MMSRCATIVPTAVLASFRLAAPESGDFVLLALRTLLARIAVYRVMAESRKIVR